jgi:hypothetical protein|tara:strand:+ start:1189 stop:1470 length:282 start_codon:yes stop_codon:yes gene_type:complete
MTPTISQMKDIMNNTTKDNIIDRDELQDQYIKELIDSMDFKTMETFVYDTINDNLDKYSVNELIDEVKDSYPELLDDTSEDDLPEPDESTGWN